MLLTLKSEYVANLLVFGFCMWNGEDSIFLIYSSQVKKYIVLAQKLCFSNISHKLAVYYQVSREEIFEVFH